MQRAAAVLRYACAPRPSRSPFSPGSCRCRGRAGAILVVGILMGGGGFALFFVGLKTASPSAASIVGQIGVPIATLLVGAGARRAHPLAARSRHRADASSGVIMVMFDPQGFDVSAGLLFVVASAFGGARRHDHDEADGGHPAAALPGLGRLLVDDAACVPLSAAFEDRSARGRLSGRLAACRGWFSIPRLVVSVFGHTTYYGLIQRYEANLVAPLTLMSPLMTIALGIWHHRRPFRLRDGDRHGARACRRASSSRSGRTAPCRARSCIQNAPE